MTFKCLSEIQKPCRTNTCATTSSSKIYIYKYNTRRNLWRGQYLLHRNRALSSWSARFLSKVEWNSMSLWRGDQDKTAVEKLGSIWFLCMYSTYYHWALQTRNTTLDQVGAGRQEWRQLGCSFDLYLLVLVSTYRRSINSITGWNEDPRGKSHQLLTFEKWL